MKINHTAKKNTSFQRSAQVRRNTALKSLERLNRLFTSIPKGFDEIFQLSTITLIHSEGRRTMRKKEKINFTLGGSTVFAA